MSVVVDIYRAENRRWYLELVEDGERRMRIGGWHCRCTAMRLYRQRYSHLELAD